jgi:hypothetical protein
VSSSHKTEGPSPSCKSLCCDPVSPSETLGACVGTTRCKRMQPVFGRRWRCRLRGTRPAQSGRQPLAAASQELAWSRVGIEPQDRGCAGAHLNKTHTGAGVSP